MKKPGLFYFRMSRLYKEFARNACIVRAGRRNVNRAMSNATCPNCGATQIVGAKFCRQCGRLVSTTSAQSVTEATTLTLRTPVQDFGAQQTNIFSSQPTSPAYLAPGQTPQPPEYTTSRLEQNNRKLPVWFVGLMITLLVAALLAFGIAKLISSRTTTQPPPVPDTPTVTVPDVPPPPQPPPPPVSGSNSISRAFIYPGAETMIDMVRGGGGSLLQLRTKDSYEKVLDWYITKLKPENISRLPGQNSILKWDKLMAVINATDEGTMIMLKQNDEMDIDIDP